MEHSEYKNMNDFEDFYWWHAGRLVIIDKLLQKYALKKPLNILNIGSGTGGNNLMLEKYGSVRGIDKSEEAAAHAKKRGYETTIADATSIPFLENSFDIAVALDVLEHIQDESEALKEWLRVLRPGGKLIISVPAYQWLWSFHDEALHHFRRYTASGLNRTLNLAGFKVLKRTYAIVFSLPIIVTYRLLRSVFPSNKKETSYVLLPKPLNDLFTWLLKVEAKFIKNYNSPFGTSVIVVATK